MANRTNTKGDRHLKIPGQMTQVSDLARTTSSASVYEDHEIDAAFPAPKPVVIRTATLRSSGRGGSKRVAYSVTLTIPKPVLDVCEWRAGDTIMVKAWANGVVRIELAGEGL